MIKQVEDYLELLKSNREGNKRKITLRNYLEKYADLSIIDLEVKTEEDMYLLLSALGVIEEVSVIAYDEIYDCKIAHVKSLANKDLEKSQSKLYFKDFRNNKVIPLEDSEKVFMVF